MLFYFCIMSSHLLTIGLVQYDILWENPGGNINLLEELLKPHEKIDLILLPEMWSTGFTIEPKKSAEAHPGQALKWMIDQARHSNTAISGSISIKEEGQYFNRWYGVLPDGTITQYDKKHLFTYGKENMHYTSGKTKQLFEFKGWKILPLICYDIRFPVWCRNTELYDLIVVAANWPQPRIQHWDALLKARAIENQCYVAAVNRIGIDGNGLVYNGQSIVYDMNGQSNLFADDQPAVQIVTLDKRVLNGYREQFRFLQDRDAFSF
jgi:predicted amidohydrolase